jgi:hypothetical protein
MTQENKTYKKSCLIWVDTADGKALIPVGTNPNRPRNFIARVDKGEKFWGWRVFEVDNSGFMLNEEFAIEMCMKCLTLLGILKEE